MCIYTVLKIHKQHTLYTLHAEICFYLFYDVKWKPDATRVLFKVNDNSANGEDFLNICCIPGTMLSASHGLPPRFSQQPLQVGSTTVPVSQMRRLRVWDNDLPKNNGWNQNWNPEIWFQSPNSLENVDRGLNHMVLATQCSGEPVLKQSPASTLQLSLMRASF